MLKRTFNTKLARNYWGAQAAGVLVIAESTGNILLAMRSSHVNESNTFGIISGAIDGGENPKEAAKREFEEETNYNGNIKMYPAFIFSDENFKFFNFIGLVEDEFKPTINWETAYFKWVNLEELKKAHPKHFGLELLLKDAKSYKLIKKLVYYSGSVNIE